MSAPVSEHATEGPEWIQVVEGKPTTLTPQARATLRELREWRARSGGLSPRDYNLTISHRHRFVWYRNAKVGTRTILGFLEQQDPELTRLSYMSCPTGQLAGYFKFGFVRHPLDRFISAWQDKVQDRNHFRFDRATREKMRTIENFAAWVAEQDLRDLATTDRHVALQSRLVDLSQVDHLGRMESFDDDFSAVCREIGLPWTSPERRNRSAPRGITRDNASADLRSTVEEIYRLDYQVFGY